MFPQIGPDLQAIKRDSSGRYYILAKPATVIWVYGSDGQLAGRIPNEHSGGTAIRYAVDIDLDSSGNLYVVDRGANMIDIFRSDGSLISKVPVFAPISVVALPGDQFAAVSLRSKYLVSIYDRSGSLYYQFGDRSEADSGAASDALVDPGKIYGDSAAHIYFAFTSMPDPMVRKYSRVGYMDYAVPLPIGGVAPGPSKPEDRLEVGLNVGQMNFSDQLGGWATLGSSGTLKFGSSMGTGFGERMRGGFAGRSSGIGGPGISGNPFGAMTPGGTGQPGALGLNGATFFGQGTLQNGHFHFDLGAGLGRSRAGRGAAAETDNSTDSDLGQASLLELTSGGLSSGPGTGSASDLTNDDTDTAILSTDSTSALSSPDAVLGMDQTDLAFEAPFADAVLQPGMFAGGAFFRPHGGGFGGGHGGGSFGGRGFGARFTPGASGGATAPGAAGPDGRPGFGSPGHFVFNTYNVVASVRVNLDRPAQTEQEKPTLTAAGVDPATGESWVAIGSQLIHLASDGVLLGAYYMATPQGTPLHSVAIRVEPNRLLLADDPLGIFSFARPDRASAAPRTQVAAGPTGGRRSP